MWVWPVLHPIVLICRFTGSYLICIEMIKSRFKSLFALTLTSQLWLIIRLRNRRLLCWCSVYRKLFSLHQTHWIRVTPIILQVRSGRTEDAESFPPAAPPESKHEKKCFHGVSAAVSKKLRVITHRLYGAGCTVLIKTVRIKKGTEPFCRDP